VNCFERIPFLALEICLKDILVKKRFIKKLSCSEKLFHLEKIYWMKE
jgi:hypothetical protein